MEISSRRISLKQQLACILGFTEISNPGEKNRFLSLETPILQSSISESETNPNTFSDERSNKEKIAPITPNKTEIQITNKTLETAPIVNEEETLNLSQKSINKKPRRKKYKPKVVREEGTKTGNSKSGNSNPGFSPLFRVPVTPNRNSQSGNLNPGSSHQNPEEKPDKSNVSIEVPITPNSKSETSKSTSILDPITPNSKSETSNNTIILDPIIPNLKSETSKSTIILDPITPDAKSETPKSTNILDPITPNANYETSNNTINFYLATPNPKSLNSNDPIKSESKLEKIEDVIVPVVKKDIVYFSKKKRNLRSVNEEKKDNLDKSTALQCDDVVVPVQKPVRRRLDFGNDAKNGNESDLIVNIFSVGTSVNCGNLIKDSNVGTDETVNEDKIGTILKCGDVMNDCSFCTESDETINNSLIAVDLIKESSVGTKSDETQYNSLIGTTLNCEDVIENCSVGTKGDETLNESLMIGTDPNCENLTKESFVGTISDQNLINTSIGIVPNSENVFKPAQETEIISKTENLNKGFTRLVLMQNLRALTLKNFKGTKLKNTQIIPKPKSKPRLSLKKLMNEIISKMKKLDLNKDLFAIVPFEGIKVRAKVVLNEESINEWKIVMGLSNSASSSGGVNLEKEKYWRDERENFENLAHGFIYQMKLIQGDRRFSEWNGSVVDSVVGAFLTQNVSDHMSSSAFISLASRFPLKRESGNISTWRHKKYADFEWEKWEKGKCSSNSNPLKAPELDNNNNSNNSNLKEGIKVPKVGKRGYKAGTENTDWNELKVFGLQIRLNKERENINNNTNSFKRVDSLDWEEVRKADVDQVAKAIHGRGMDNVLAERIQDFLNRVANDHGSIDLEWLRYVPEEKAKEYLLSIYGLGLKSVECIRLLTLHQVAFPVDTNVGRICVRLGWVPLEPLPESVQIHLLELYPVMDSIQKYLWPRLCKLDQKTLYELHYQMITFGKVFCTKSKPNCNSCPLRSECKHFASAFATAKLALPGPGSTSTPIGQIRNPFSFQTDFSSKSENPIPILLDSSKTENPIPVPIPLNTPNTSSETGNPIPVFTNSTEPIIEEPSTPPHEIQETQENQEPSDIEDLFSLSDSEEIPTIDLNMNSFIKNVEMLVRENEREEVRIEDISRALVVMPSVFASIPLPELKNPGRLRTVHDVYELPDGHSILKWMNFERRVEDDPCQYLLVLWNSENTSGNIVPLSEEEKKEYVLGSILIPCRTAMRGSFPLNGTYFQVNEVFADYQTARNPIRVRREEIWRLRRLPCYFGTSVSTVLKGLSTDTIQICFWRGFICVREFDRETRSPKPLSQWLHYNPSKMKKHT